MIIVEEQVFLMDTVIAGEMYTIVGVFVVEKVKTMNVVDVMVLVSKKDIVIAIIMLTIV